MVENLNTYWQTQYQPTYQPKLKEEKNEVDTKTYVLGGLAATTVNTPVRRIFTKPVSQHFFKTLEKISKADQDTYKAAFNNAFQHSKLGTKGITITDLNTLTEANAEATLRPLAEKMLPKWYTKLLGNNKKEVNKLVSHLEKIRKGKNACFAPNAKTIVLNSDKMAVAAFHEMGHALNQQSTGIIKILKNLKGLRALTPLILLTAAFKNKKAEGEKPVGAFDKVTTFVKNHCGILTTAALIPTVIEEGIASIRGSKAAKPLLDERLYKQLNKFHGKAWLTYAASAVAAGFAVEAVSWVQDKISHSKS